MSRSRKADHEAVIDAAQAVFWDRGYAGASTREIEERTGLTRFTLQKSYGGKEAFFLETLDAYLDRAEAEHFPCPETTTLEQLADWVDALSDADFLPEKGAQGCLLVNTITEFQRGGAAADARIQRYFEGLQERFTRILAKAVTSGSARPGLHPEEGARVLITLLLGLSIIMKARQDDGFARAHIASAADLVRSWQAER